MAHNPIFVWISDKWEFKEMVFEIWTSLVFRHLLYSGCLKSGLVQISNTFFHVLTPDTLMDQVAEIKFGR